MQLKDFNSQNTEKQHLTSFYDNPWRCAATQYQRCLKIVVNADRQVSSSSRQITQFSQVSSLPRKSLQCFPLHLPFQILHLSQQLKELLFPRQRSDPTFVNCRCMLILLSPADLHFMLSYISQHSYNSSTSSRS